MLTVCDSSRLSSLAINNLCFTVICHALLAGNASSELSYLDNIKDHISRQSPAVVPSLLSREDVGWNTSTGSGFQAPRMTTETNRNRNIYVHSEEIVSIKRKIQII